MFIQLRPSCWFWKQRNWPFFVSLSDALSQRNSHNFNDKGKESTEILVWHFNNRTVNSLSMLSVMFDLITPPLKKKMSTIKYPGQFLQYRAPYWRWTRRLSHEWRRTKSACRKKICHGVLGTAGAMAVDVLVIYCISKSVYFTNSPFHKLH